MLHQIEHVMRMGPGIAAIAAFILGLDQRKVGGRLMGALHRMFARPLEAQARNRRPRRRILQHGRDPSLAPVHRHEGNFWSLSGSFGTCTACTGSPNAR
jgi:predicted lipid-binding transport protein (Tim44 family)